MDWLHDTTIRLAEDAGIDAAGLEVDAETRKRLLKIARVAAHTSERINAPLLCYVLGLMAAQGYDVTRAAEALEIA